MPFFSSKERQSKEIVKGVRIRTFWGDKLMLSLVEMDRGAEVPLHDHPHEQAGVVLEGQMELGIGLEKKLLKQGEMYVIPGNVKHYAKPVSGPCKALDIFSPVREEYKY
jgi:quercetin dioxygenase-like cupin family protein